MSYKLTKYLQSDGTYVNKTVVRLSDGSSIPFDEANRDYQEYLKWLNGEDPYTEKGTPEAAD